MAKQKTPSRKQLAVIDDLFTGELSEEQLLDKHELSRKVYNRWMAGEQAKAEFAKRIELLKLQGRLIIARYASVAAAKLVNLTESKSEETARKACLDIISLPNTCEAAAAADESGSGGEDGTEISPEAASKILAILADEQNQSKNSV
ncbi:MAG: hypothetical protein ACYSSI_14100 [Planctomycetota bacterium]|jgi:hypothetical protein